MGDVVEEEEESDGKLPSLSKKALRKIKLEGPYGGKNITRLDGEGKPMKKTEYDSNYLHSLRKGDAKNKDGSKMQIHKDGDISDDSAL